MVTDEPFDEGEDIDVTEAETFDTVEEYIEDIKKEQNNA